MLWCFLFFLIYIAQMCRLLLIEEMDWHETSACQMLQIFMITARIGMIEVKIDSCIIKV